jgi:hypothetical protein
MSLARISAIAVDREVTTPKRRKRKAKKTEDLEKDQQELEKQSYLGVLTDAIPTEPLALYTFLIAAIVATIDAEETERLLMRWIIYGVFVAFIVAWIVASWLRNRTKKVRKFPLAEVGTAVIAFAAWGLVMPESPLMAELDSGDDQAVWTAIITTAGVGLLGVFGVSLKEEAKKTGD